MTLQKKLPAIGEPGTIARDQRRALKRLAIPQVDDTTLSREQAEILLDRVAYIQSVWESDLDRQMSDLSPALLDEALRIILDHDSQWRSACPQLLPSVIRDRPAGEDEDQGYQTEEVFRTKLSFEDGSGGVSRIDPAGCR